MRKFLISSILAIAAITPAAVTLAASHGGGNGGGMHAAGAMHNAPAANSNGVKSADRDKGLDRAADRRNSNSVTRKHAKKGHKKNK